MLEPYEAINRFGDTNHKITYDFQPTFNLRPEAASLGAGKLLRIIKSD